ncbi:unnamed protein product [Hyaloperonospora brassicae]|uniref:Uncharacterized protein n=1 Tax=Hyaloperonospora brassicae TaxID=162125 RepID=A0AAV0U5U3_HYABA|nr:unnamed protein product [Hyaloperonospora brassicae]
MEVGVHQPRSSHRIPCRASFSFKHFRKDCKATDPMASAASSTRDVTVEQIATPDLLVDEIVDDKRLKSLRERLAPEAQQRLLDKRRQKLTRRRSARARRPPVLLERQRGYAMSRCGERLLPPSANEASCEGQDPGEGGNEPTDPFISLCAKENLTKDAKQPHFIAACQKCPEDCGWRRFDNSEQRWRQCARQHADQRG